VDFGGGAAPLARRDEIEPLSAERSRIHVNVSRQFTRKLEAARRGLGHAIPHATIEQALEAALDLLLEKQAKRRGQVKKPRATRPAKPQVADAKGERARPREEALQQGTVDLTLALVPNQPPPHRRTGPREAIPAAVRRAVWERDGGRCSWPLDGGGTCGSTHRLELDHQLPWARFSEPTVDNLRVLCRHHNVLAARQAFGNRCVARYAGPSAG
jgi:5-methylcytosine-specific restriction endonuclease McrA